MTWPRVRANLESTPHDSQVLATHPTTSNRTWLLRWFLIVIAMVGPGTAGCTSVLHNSGGAYGLLNERSSVDSSDEGVGPEIVLVDRTGQGLASGSVPAGDRRPSESGSGLAEVPSGNAPPSPVESTLAANPSTGGGVDPTSLRAAQTPVAPPATADGSEVSTQELATQLLAEMVKITQDPILMAQLTQRTQEESVTGAAATPGTATPGTATPGTGQPSGTGQRPVAAGGVAPMPSASLVPTRNDNNLDNLSDSGRGRQAIQTGMASQSVPQRFQVQVVDPRSDAEREAEAQWARQQATAEAMSQAVQQVTQRGLSRLAGGSGASPASPELETLLMDQMQQAMDPREFQQAAANVESLEANAQIPAFDLNGNRPLRARSPLGDEDPLRNRNRVVTYADQGTTEPVIQSSASEDIPVGDWESNIVQAMFAVEQAAANANSDNERQSLEIYLRLLRLIANDRDAAVRSIESLPGQRQTFWREQLFALSQIMEAPEDERGQRFINHSRQATKALAHLQNAMQALQTEATLQLKQVQFCEEIRSFGDYDRARSTMVQSGDPMLVYCEVVNYTTKSLNGSSGEFFQTHLVPSYMIFDDRQQVVSQKEFSVVQDRCRSRRQDFYLVLQLEVPDLSSGKYHLQVSVEDTQAGKIAVSAPLSFQVR